MLSPRALRPLILYESGQCYSGYISYSITLSPCQTCCTTGSDVFSGKISKFNESGTSQQPSAHQAHARPAVPLGLWSITVSLHENFYVPHLRKFITWCLWCLNALVNTNVFSDWGSSIALKPIILSLIMTTKCTPTKPYRDVRLPWQTSTASRLFEGAGTL